VQGCNVVTWLQMNRKSADVQTRRS